MEQKIYLDPLASWQDKLKDEYGLAFAESVIANDWFGQGNYITGDCNYATRRDWIINKRLTARGKQNVQSYKDHFERNKGDLDYLNIEFEQINWAQKFCRIVSNGIKDDYYTLDIKAVDRHTVLNNKKKADEHRKNMRTLPLLQRTKEVLGIDMIPKGFIPESEEELKLYADINDRPKIEIAEEIMINYIKEVNKYHNIEDIKNKDAVEIGIMAGRNWTDNTDGIKLASLDPERLIHSYVERNDFSDCYYYGYIESLTINDIKREIIKSGKKYSSKEELNNDLRKIAGSYTTQNKGTVDVDSCNMSKLLNWKVDVVRFSFKTLKNDVYKVTKKKGKVVKVTKRDANFNPPERNDYGRIDDIKDTWLEGNYVIGANFVYDYKEAEKIIRDELNKAKSSFIVRATDIYKNQLHSFLDNIEVPAKMLQKAHLKIQHLMAELKPDMTILNEDMLADLGSGDPVQNWKDALSIMQVKNVVIEKMVDMGEPGARTLQGARSVAVQQGSALAPLLNIWAKYYNLIRETTGINPARDGSLPHDALLGVNEMAQIASNTVTKHIVDASIDFNLSFAESISSRIHAIFRNKDAAHLRKIYERAVGKQNIEALEVLKDRHLHDFGFTADMIPTSQVLKEFKEDLSLSIKDGSIDVEIKYEAEQIAKTSLKQATQYLIYMRKKRRKEQMKEQMMLNENKSKNDIASNSAASQNQMKLLQVKTQMEIQKEQKLAEIEIRKQQALNQINAPKEHKEFQESVYLEKIKAMSDLNIKEFLEDRKDKRVSQQSTEQSKMIKQRNNNGDPIDFTTNNLDDIFANMF